jgi:hypothetical protein
MTEQIGLSLTEVQAVCDEAKAKNCKVLLHCVIEEDNDADHEQWDLIGLATDYLWQTPGDKNSSSGAGSIGRAGEKAAISSKDVFAGVYLDIIGMHNREIGDVFLIDSGSFKKGEYIKRPGRQSMVYKASKEDLLLYMDHPSKPAIITQILDGRIKIL